MLAQWAAEGRLIPTTVLIDEATGAQFYAQDVPGLIFPGAPQVSSVPGVGTPLGGYSTPVSQPTYAPYGQQTPFSGAPRAAKTSAVTTSYVVSGVGLFLICCFTPLGLLCGLGGIGLALSARNADPRGARGAIWLGIGVVLLNGGLLVAGSYLMRFLQPGG